jgi:hypothetical protein
VVRVQGSEVKLRFQFFAKRPNKRSEIKSDQLSVKDKNGLWSAVSDGKTNELGIGKFATADER